MPAGAKFPHKVPAYIPKELLYDFNQEVIPEFRKDPWAVLDVVRREAPPIFYSSDSNLDHGEWHIMREDYVREFLQSPDIFTTEMGLGGGPNPWPRKIIPLELDPPEHGKYRALLAPVFSPKAIDSLEQQVREIIADLIDNVKDKGSCEFLNDFARPLPSTIILNLMGLPLDRRAEFVGWVGGMFHNDTVEARQEAGRQAFGYLQNEIQARYKSPQNDLITELCQAEVDGKPLPIETVEDMVMFVFQAGLDTVTAGLGHIFWYLARNPGKRRELIENPGLIPNAVEEILRAFAWIGVLRRVRVDEVTFHGAPMRHGDVVHTIPYAADHDPRGRDDPDTIDFNRESISHFAFGGGVHRCAGSHLARRELRIAVEQWLERIGDFEVKPGTELEYSPYSMFQLTSLPLVWKA